LSSEAGNYNGDAIVHELRSRFLLQPADFTSEDIDFLKSLNRPRARPVGQQQNEVIEGTCVVEMDGVFYRWSPDGGVTLNQVAVPVSRAVRVLAKLQPLFAAQDAALALPHELIHAAAKLKGAGQFDRGEKLARRALALEPSSLVAATTLSSIMRAKNDPEAAIAVTDQHTSCQDPALWTTRAAALQDVGRFVDAAEAIQNAWTFSNGNPSAELHSLSWRIKGEATTR